MSAKKILGWLLLNICAAFFLLFLIAVHGPVALVLFTLAFVVISMLVLIIRLIAS